MSARAAPQERELVSLNPATLEPVGCVARTDPAEVPALVADARCTFEEWRKVPAEHRARVLREASRVIRERADQIVDTVVAETGKPRTEGISQDLYPSIDHAEWLARNAPRILRRERVPLSQMHVRHKKAWLLHEPFGVVAVISPWNIPFAIPFREVATAVAAGNGVVLKPSELTPLSSELVRRVLEDAGAPRGLVQVTQGEGPVGEAVVGDAGIAKVFFTGSVGVGRRVAAAAGARGCPVVLELGGRDAMVVFADADLDRAVDFAAWGSFLNGGQACVSVERIYVERPVHDEFLARLTRRAQELRLGEEVGPLISERQRDHVEQLVTGARPLAGGRRGETLFYEPTVIAGRLLDEEIFGPVVGVEPFDSEEEAVRRTNETRFGLAASVWTRDLTRARRVAERIEAGMVWTNDFGYSFGVGAAAWGGVKASGFGRVHSRHGLYECVQIKYVDQDRGRVRAPWSYPYDERTERSLVAMLDILYGTRLERVRAAWRHRGDLAHILRRSLRT